MLDENTIGAPGNGSWPLCFQVRELALGGYLRRLTSGRAASKPPAAVFSSFRATILSICVGVLPAACLRVPEEFPEEPDGTPAAPSTVSEVLERHVAGLGGEKALQPLSQRTVEARMVIHPEEGCEEGSETCQWQEKTGSFLFQTTAGGQMYRRNVIDEIVEERTHQVPVGVRVLRFR